MTKRERYEELLERDRRMIDEITTLRARVEELKKERARECAWTLDGEPTQAIEWYDTGCGRQASVGAALMADRPCWCGGKVRVE